MSADQNEDQTKRKYAITRWQYDRGYGVHAGHAFTGEAAMTLHLIEKWGPVVGIFDGEDSAGRAKMRNATPAEVATQAADIAAAAYKEIAARGWLIEMPAPPADELASADTRPDKQPASWDEIVSGKIKHFVAEPA